MYAEASFGVIGALSLPPAKTGLCIPLRGPRPLEKSLAAIRPQPKTIVLRIV